MPALQKQPVNISFAEGVDLKTDPNQVKPGKFLRLINSVFDKVGRLTKRNGFKSLLDLPDSSTSYLTTSNGDLQAIGTNILSFSENQDQWLTKGSTYPLRLSTMPLIRNALNQTQCDSAIAANGVICVVYSQSDGSATTYRYALIDSTNGQNIISPAAIPVGSGTITNAPRVYLLGYNFIIVFENIITSVQHLQYVAINSITGAVVRANTDLSVSLENSTTGAFDGVVVNGRLFLAWNGASAEGIYITALQTNLVQTTIINPDAAHVATLMSVCADTSNSSGSIIWATYYDLATTSGYTLAIDYNLNIVRAPTQWENTLTVLNVTSLADNANNNIFYEVSNNYGFDSGIPSHYVITNSITQSGTVGTPAVSARSVGLASKAFRVSGTAYYLAAYQSPYQPTYFLIDGSTSLQSAPKPIMKLAYQNGGGYLVTGLPSVSVAGTAASVPYLFKDLIQAVNKNTNVPSGSQVAGIYSQTGINLATINFDTEGLSTVDIGGDLHLTGGFLWMYDGYRPVEHNFLLYPDSVKVQKDNTSGSVSHQQYYYQVTYEWTDNQGNAFKSAPSIPAGVDNTDKSSIKISVPNLRLTYKIGVSPVKIVIYRWSAAQQTYYQVTSITVPTLNSPQSDYTDYIDTNADATILGNNILYTTGGVVEDVGAPASSSLSLFDNRLWLIDAEDTNLLWYSKEVIENTPVEMSDLFTRFVAPTIGAQGSTGKIRCLYPMDDKLIIFKDDAIYYINGVGPDNTGANNQYSQPIFITSTVGCSNQRSIAFMPMGLMFQSNKGIWLLGRDLSTRYIGDAVEAFNSSTVTSAQTIPGTNQVRFSLDTGEMLMYDYYVQQWGWFEGIPSVSSTLYGEAHVLVNQYGKVSRETPNHYLDGSRPVLMSFTTSWLNMAGLRGYIRSFWFYILGEYLSPHKLQVSVAYDYNSSPTQSSLYTPPNTPTTYGNDPYYGGDGFTPMGGVSPIEQFRFFLQRQRCRAFQLSIQEVFDPSFGTEAGPGLTLSGLNVIAAYKKSYAPIQQNQQIG